MNWFQQLGASIFGLQPYLTEQWGQDLFLLDPRSEFDSPQTDRLKMLAVFSNPAVLKVFKLQCDMFSLGKISVYNKSGVEKKNDPVLRLLMNPNPFQQKSQLLWDYMFWKMMGNAYCYVDSDNAASDSNKMYFLDSYKMFFPDSMRQYKDMIVLSGATEKAINDQLITYNYASGGSIQIKWGRISHIADLTNGSGDWFRGRSSVDALFQVIGNSKESLKAKNITTRYAGKYMVAGKADPSNVSQMPMAEDEKQNIETKMNGPKSVHAVKSMIDIKRFVEDAAVIGQLDSAYWDDYYKVGNLYGIPGEVLEAYNEKGATYENQEKARGAHVDYTLSPAGELFTNSLEKRFGYEDKDIVISWSHLPFTKAYLKDKANTDKAQSEALINLMKAGVKLEEINSILDTEFSELDYEPAKRSNQTGTDSQNSNNSQPAN